MPSLRASPSEPPPAPDLAQGLAHWRRAAQAQVADLRPEVRFEEFGRVQRAADGIAHISGLRGARLNELLHFDAGRQGYVAGLGAEEIACVLLDDSRRLQPGERVQRSGDVLRVPVGPALLGRVLDPLGRVLDGGAALEVSDWLPAERPAPGILERELVHEPVHTGTLVVDALFPLGRGQRELIIGDRGTGKTALALEAVLAQRDTELVCVYVSVGQKSESVASVIEAVRRHGAPKRCIFVVASGSDAPGLQWLAPFAGFSMAEYFRDRGAHALVVIDDLSQHAATHRELALLMQQPPGREAYPGDIFHVHARLLERAARLSAARGGGSLTALPIAQTEAGNLSAYIPTNLISITDGQIVLNSRLFDLGHLPAVDTGLSVSRVGGKTQAPLMREAVSSMRLDYAVFQELEMFTRFGTELDARVQQQMARGRLIRAALAQPRLAPQPEALQLALLLGLQAGWLDALAPAALGPLRERLGAALQADAGLSARLAGRDGGAASLDGLRDALRPVLARAVAG